jgi:hypothetical protein
VRRLLMGKFGGYKIKCGMERIGGWGWVMV